MSIPTPHINAKLGDFAPTVLMPGDPLHSTPTAEIYTLNPLLANTVCRVKEPEDT